MESLGYLGRYLSLVSFFITDVEWIVFVPVAALRRPVKSKKGTFPTSTCSRLCMGQEGLSALWLEAW